MEEEDFETPLQFTEIKFGDELPKEVMTTLKLIGKKWALPILYQIHEKNLGFADLKKSLVDNANISSNMLSRVLDELQSYQLVEKRIVSTSPIRVEYSSTILGKDFCDLCQVIGAFGKKYLESSIENNNI